MMGLISKMKQKVKESQQKKKAEEEWRKDIEEEVRMESREEIKAGIKKAIIKKETDRILKKEKNKFASAFSKGSKLDKMMSNVEELQKKDSGSENIMSQDKIKSMLGKSSIITQDAKIDKSEKDEIFSQDRLKKFISLKK